MSSTISPLHQPEPLHVARSRRLIPGAGASNSQSRELHNRGTRSRLRIITTNQSQFKAPSASAQAAYNKLTQGEQEPAFQDFLLTNYSFESEERHQVMQPFGDTEVVNYFGRAPLYLNIEGMLVDDIDNQWFLEFMWAYQEFLRGSQLARNKAILKLYMQSSIATGAILGLSISKDARREIDVPFKIRMLVQDMYYPEIGSAALTASARNQLKKLSSDFMLGNFSNTTTPSISNMLTGGVSSTGFNLPLSMSSHPAAKQAASTSGGGSFVNSATSFLHSAEKSIGGRLSGISSFAKNLYSKANGALSTVENRASGAYTEVSGSLSSGETHLSNLFGQANSMVSKSLAYDHTAIGNVRSIGLEVGSIANTVRHEYRTLAADKAAVISDYRNTANVLKNTAGVVGYLPENFFQTAKTLVQDGRLSGAVLNNSSNNLGANASLPSNLVSGISSYDPTQGAVLP